MALLQYNFEDKSIIGWDTLFLGAFAELRKTTMSFVMSGGPSVRSFVRMEQLDSHWTDFHKIWYLRIFWNSVEKIQVLLKSEKNKRVLYMKTNTHFYHISLISS